MKIQVDLDGELWAKFRSKVHHEGKTLGSVVPTLFEPALRLYVEETIRDVPPVVPPVPLKNTCDKCGREITGIEWLRGDGMVKLCNDCMTVPATTQESPPQPEPPPTGATEDIKEQVREDYRTLAKAILNEGTKQPPPLPTVKRCDLCDQVVDRLFASGGKRVCYTCWRAELTAGQ